MKSKELKQWLEGYDMVEIHHLVSAMEDALSKLEKKVAGSNVYTEFNDLKEFYINQAGKTLSVSIRHIETLNEFIEEHGLEGLLNDQKIQHARNQELN